MNISKENPKYSSTDFAKFIQDFYHYIKVIFWRTIDKPAKKLTFKEMFNDTTTDFEGDCYFDAPHKIITSK